MEGEYLKSGLDGKEEVDPVEDMFRRLAAFVDTWSTLVQQKVASETNPLAIRSFFDALLQDAKRLGLQFPARHAKQLIRSALMQDDLGLENYRAWRETVPGFRKFLPVVKPGKPEVNPFLGARLGLMKEEVFTNEVLDGGDAAVWSLPHDVRGSVGKVLNIKRKKY